MPHAIETLSVVITVTCPRPLEVDLVGLLVGLAVDATESNKDTPDRHFI